MDLQELKKILNRAGFSEESLELINEILDKAIERGYITSEEKTKLLGIIDTEIEGANIEAEALDEIALALESFADDLDRATEKAQEEFAEIEKSLSSELEEIVNQASIS